MTRVLKREASKAMVIVLLVGLSVSWSRRVAW